jgi:hypothetical protein
MAGEEPRADFVYKAFMPDGPGEANPDVDVLQAIVESFTANYCRILHRPFHAVTGFQYSSSRIGFPV